VQFSEPQFDETLLHVDRDPHGFPTRRTANPKPDGLPVAHIFVFGGSTTYGFLASDDQTWPSYLSTALNEKAKRKGVAIEVPKYGHNYFNRIQEAVLLADVLKSGHRPALAIFMDGVNETTPTDVPEFTEQAKKGFRGAQFPPSFVEEFGPVVPILR